MKRTGWLLVAVACATSLNCAGVLGLDDYASAIDELCKCDTELGFLSDCRAKLEGRLSSVSEPTRQEWLEFYGANCAGACLKALECYDQPGTCATISCSSDNECCGGSKGEGSCNVATKVCNP